MSISNMYQNYINQIIRHDVVFFTFDNSIEKLETHPNNRIFQSYLERLSSPDDIFLESKTKVKIKTEFGRAANLGWRSAIFSIIIKCSGN